MRNLTGNRVLQRAIAWLRHIVKGWGFAEAAVVGTIVVIIPFAMAYEALSRYAFEQSPLGLEEFTLLIAAYAYFIGAAHASRKRQHVTVTLIDVIKMPEKIRHGIAVFSAFLCFAAPAAFFYYTLDFNLWVADSPMQLRPFGWPYWVWTVAMPIGMLVMAIYELRNFVQTVRGTAVNGAVAPLCDEEAVEC